jgi:hypothetical protein
MKKYSLAEWTSTKNSINVAIAEGGATETLRQDNWRSQSVDKLAVNSFPPAMNPVLCTRRGQEGRAE